jgi:DNA polymerase-3 subunit gamma/tau
MSYQALYRQWRPIDFDEIIGQSHITIPLKNQIQSQSYGHAYIFSGTRGTGKTSTAKIFSRAVNCLNNKDGNPCNKCANCLSILEDQFIDVVEMDAASNNSVDDIRELREHIKFAPSRGKYKVYIIDEVHMLSTGAFNALLKTLEEPPEYVLFILATTEIHKIPATILSRCQRFDFKRVSYEQILGRLEHICGQLDIEYDVEALKLIIQKSDGAVRDTLSALDQCLSISEKKLSIADVVEILGVVEKTQILTLVQFIEQNQSEEVLLTVDNILKQGKDLNQFVNSMIEVYRDLLIVSMVKDNHSLLIDASSEYIESLLDLVKAVTPSHFSRALDHLLELSKQLKYAQNKRALFEAVLIRLLYPQTESNYSSLLERISRLEKIIENGDIAVKKTNQSNSSHRSFEVPKAQTTQTTQTTQATPVIQGMQTATEMTTSHKTEDATKQNEIESFIEFTDEEVSISNINEKWHLFIEQASVEKKGIMPMLQGALPYSYNGTKCQVNVSPENKMFLSILNSNANVNALGLMLSRLIKKNIQLEFVSEEIQSKKESEEEQIKDFFKDYTNVLEIK